LAVSGFLLQAFFRNPIAGPFVLGVSSGARMAVGFTMIVLMRYIPRVPVGVMVLAAFTGSMLTMGLVLLFAKRVRSMAMLLVVGVMIGYICSAITDFFITFAREADIVNLTAWSMGSFSGIRWSELQIASAVIFAALIGAFALSKPIGAYQLGEGYAQSVGINIKLFRVALIVIASVLAGTVTAFAGTVSFVGIAVPHITRLALGTAKPVYAIPACFLCGAAFCMFCDLIARTAFAPVEIAIGTVTAAFGAPVVIWLLISRKKEKAS
jgi:iron complex transport system permease protein